MSGQSEAHITLTVALGRVEQLQAAGRATEAEQLCRQLVAGYPGRPEPLNTLALLLKGRGALDEAEAAAGHALSLAPREPALHNNLGGILLRKGRLDAAEKAYRQAITLNRSYPEAYYNLSVVLRQSARDDEALAALRRAVVLRPDYVEALTQLGALLIDRGQSGDALAPLDAALRVNARYFPAIYYRALALAALERYEAAVDALRFAISLQPSSYEARFALGNTLVRAHREAEALEAYREAAELTPGSLEAHYHYSSLAWTLGRADQVFDTYTRARQRIGEDPNLLIAEGSLRLRLGDAAAAEGLAQRACRVAPRRLDGTNLLAQAYTSQQRFGEAVDLLRAAVAAEPGEIIHRRELGIALLRMQDANAAVQALEEAVRLAPQDQLLLAFLSLAYREAGNGGLDRLVDFDRFVRVYELEADDVEGFNRDVAEALRQLHTRKVEPFDQTLRGGTQTAGRLFDLDVSALASLREKIRRTVEGYVRDLPDDPEHPFLARKSARLEFAGSWSCRLQSQGFHTNHVHNEGWISSAYYVALPPVVVSGAEQQGWLKFGESNLELGARDKAARTIQPVVGRLVLFPSYYWHGTVPFSDAGERLTVAFDVVPR